MARSPSGTSDDGGSGGSEYLFRGSSAAAEKVRGLITRAARVNATVLVSGESGVGKELVARDIHARSTRSDRAFITVNCAAIPESLIEAELFGHEVGAYTDARNKRRGAFELADQGTLFLDEVGDLATSAQPKLLRALESGEITPVGGEKTQHLDLRVIAATNHNLKSMCRGGRFRSDLYYRLCVVEIRVPPLRERLEDLPVLADHFARTLAKKTGREYTSITPEALEYLQSYDWPGNVRQLKHLVERALAMSSGYVLDEDCFDLDPASSPGIRSLLNREWRPAREGFEAAYARRLLERYDGNVTKAARAAGLAPGSFYKMLRRLGLPPGRRSS